jgi:N-methyl-L-proline demethylase
VSKIAAGEEDRIRPCVGANYCLDAIYESGDAKCIHNAATGREKRMHHVIDAAPTVRKAVVIGAGPAGLEAARVLGERGHRVVVLEAADAPGGQVRLAATAHRRRDLIGIIDWRISEAKHFGVEFRYDVYADAETVLAERPDVVIVATGGLPNRSFLRVGEHLVVDTWDVMSGTVNPRGRVLVYDDNGAEPALDAAELVATRGATVEFVTPERVLAPAVGSMNSHGSATTIRSVRPNGSSTTWSWSTEPCPTTSCTSSWWRRPATAEPWTTWPCSTSGRNP